MSIKAFFFSGFVDSHELLLEEYGVSKKWVCFHGQETGQNAAATQAETSGSSAQDRYCARGPGGGAKKQRANGDQ